MKYEFANCDGQVTEVDYPMGKAPRIGDLIMHEGTELIRVASVEIDRGVEQKVHGYPYRTHQHPKFTRGFDHDSAGNNYVKSRSHERELESMHELKRY